jgi:hypothetical protein
MTMNRVKLAFVWMGLWVAFGLVLDTLIGTKQLFYLTDPLRREMWRLAHAHGVLLAAVFVLVARLHGFGGRPAPERLMFLGLLLMPCGFFLGGLAPTETDPGAGVWLVPLGGFLYLLGLFSALAGRMDRSGT